MLLTPGLITMTITATRMHRSLIDYASGFPDVYDTLNLLYLLSYSMGAISFQCLRKGEFQSTKEQYRILNDQTGPGRINFTGSDRPSRGNRAYGFRATYDNTDHDER